MSLPAYCSSRFVSQRRLSREVRVGPVGVGGSNPIRVQSMTTTPTQDVEATVRQCIALAEVGCEIVRITAPNVAAAEALKDIRAQFTAAGFEHIPLVADIHFLPKAAMEAAKWVEKVRINPGNYADKKKFAQREYNDREYVEELERLHEAFSPIVLRCKELGRAMRIGTNHGSLSDRIMNRYGDSPLGMCESALEFIRIAESHGFHGIVLSMKASNPKVMIQAYRLMVAKMAAEDMRYPLHLGVTEAGDGDDARTKSAIGIGSLLYDGLGDTIRVSLTEDPVYEVPVAKDLARKAETLWARAAEVQGNVRTAPDTVNPFEFRRRAVELQPLGGKLPLNALEPPRVVLPSPQPLSAGLPAIVDALKPVQRQAGEAKAELLQVRLEQAEDLAQVAPLREALRPLVDACVWELSGPIEAADLEAVAWTAGDVLLDYFEAADTGRLENRIALAARFDLRLAVNADPVDLPALADVLAAAPKGQLIFTLGAPDPAQPLHPLGAYRQLAEVVNALGLKAPIWIRNTVANALDPQPYFGDQLLEASILSGGLICDGIGDLISVETVPDPRQALALSYGILQGSRARTTRTEYVACPSCGRTLFDLQTTTQRIRSATGHLKGVTIAVMGCIVNGPGEMADADFGYVGGAPGKVNLYVGKECVKYHIPSAEAVDELIALIKHHGKWQEPKPVEV
ncbi:MAG: (E)-4-hydroxy-3-methylbut-2-enyl-diphosphate synthase [Verrucomicrobiota bacterium JB022]|nr:(E)-4-hydroxy-3-methylbut-2-enyl-diphosphate synthase [Verrucomicrobiota bacterium JB022]